MQLQVSEQGGLLAASAANAYQAREAARVFQVSVCDRIQTPPRVPSQEPHGFKALQVSTLRVHMRQFVHASLPLEVTFEIDSIQLCRMHLLDQVLQQPQGSFGQIQSHLFNEC